MLGDINAMIGKEQAFKPTTGLYSLHDTRNNNSMKLIDLATLNRFHYNEHNVSPKGYT